MDPVDKLTLELMMNKTHYQKYLAKMDPARYQENQDHIRKIRKYRHRILELTSELLDNYMDSRPTNKHNNEVNESCDEYIRTCIQYFEMRDLEIQMTSVSPDDNDVMFNLHINECMPKATRKDTLVLSGSLTVNENKMVENTNIEHEPDKEPDKEFDITTSSVWGKPIKKGKLSYYTMDMYMKKK